MARGNRSEETTGEDDADARATDEPTDETASPEPDGQATPGYGSGSVTIRANANLSIGNKPIAYGETAEVTDGAEVRDAIAAGLAEEVE